MGNISIKIDNLSFFYSKKGEKVLDISHLEIENGQIVSLLGPNGAGKSTLMKILTGFLNIKQKIVFINGIDVSNNVRIKNLIGVMPQENNLYLGMSAIDNLLLHGFLFNIPKKVMNQRIEYWLKKVGLFEKRKQLVKKFSGGMLRRLVFVRSVLHNPEILLFDEPTAGLDVQTKMLIWEFIVELKKAGKLILITTHNIEEAEKVSDTVIIIDHGNILAEGTSDDIREKFVGTNVLEISGDFELQKIEEILPDFIIKPGFNGTYQIQVISDLNTTKIINKFTENNIILTKFSTRETTLEEVFITLTGREIRA